MTKSRNPYSENDQYLFDFALTKARKICYSQSPYLIQFFSMSHLGDFIRIIGMIQLNKLLAISI